MDDLNEGWKIYRTRFLIKARQLDQPLVFIDPLGREQCGRPGDYLIEASDGWRTIQRREIFEDIYVAMDAAESEGRPRQSRTAVSGLKPGIIAGAGASA